MIIFSPSPDQIVCSTVPKHQTFVCGSVNCYKKGAYYLFELSDVGLNNENLIGFKAS